MSVFAETSTYLADSIVDDFVGEVKDHHKTDVINVYSNRYRINVWILEKGELVDRYKIKDSYFVAHIGGKIIDKTLGVPK
jgi:hypothetical protein